VTKKVSDVIEVKDCIAGVRAAMAQEDYEKACEYIKTFLTVDQSVLEGQAIEQLHAAEAQLKDIVRKRVDDATKQNNDAEIIRFCKLFTPLGLGEEGLRRYCTYLCGQVQHNTTQHNTIHHNSLMILILTWFDVKH
jgi:conserved oligomeric Golgi complex subunit 4